MARINNIPVIMAILAIVVMVCQAYPESQFLALREKRDVTQCATKLASCITGALTISPDSSDDIAVLRINNGTLTCALNSVNCIVTSLGGVCNTALALVGVLIGIVIGLVNTILSTLGSTCAPLSGALVGITNSINSLLGNLAGVTGIIGTISGLINPLTGIVIALTSGLVGALGGVLGAVLGIVTTLLFSLLGIVATIG